MFFRTFHRRGILPRCPGLEQTGVTWTQPPRAQWNCLLQSEWQERAEQCGGRGGCAPRRSVRPPDEQEAPRAHEVDCAAERLRLGTKEGVNAEHDALVLNKHENEVRATRIKLVK